VHAGVLWKNHFNLDNHVSFDYVPPKNEVLSGSFSQDSSGGFQVSDDGAIWDSVEPPTKQQCLDRIATHSEKTISGEAGRQICYRTSEGRVVYIKILSIVEQGGRLATSRYETEVTIWNR
jgi:hypothetical protein